MKDVDLEEPTSFLDHVYLGCTQRKCEISKDIVDNYRTMSESRISAGALENYLFRRNRMRIFLHGRWTWKITQRNVWKDIANLQTKRLSNYTKSQLHAWMTINLKKKNESVGELSTVCSQIVLKCLYLARIGRLDILWSVNKLARSVTKWTKSCDKHLTRLISYIHHTCEFTQYCHMGTTIQQCRLGLFLDSHFAGDLEDSK